MFVLLMSQSSDTGRKLSCPFVAILANLNISALQIIMLRPLSNYLRFLLDRPFAFDKITVVIEGTDMYVNFSKAFGLQRSHTNLFFGNQISES